MLLRAISLEDLDELMTIEEACFPSLSWGRRDYVHEIEVNPFAHFYGVDDEDGLCGVIGIWFMYDQSTITTLGILPEKRGRGYAKKLLTYALEEAREAGCKNCTLEVRVSNTPAISLYTSLGFVKKAIRKDYYIDNHEDAYLMELEGGLLWQQS